MDRGEAKLGPEQRQYPRFGLGVPVTLVFTARGLSVAGELQDISCGGCFFKSSAIVDLDRRISLVLAAASSGWTCRASGRVVRTQAYTGFAVLFDDDGSRAVGDFIKAFAPLSQERRVAYLSTELKPEIQIF
jgi:PilZ domain